MSDDKTPQPDYESPQAEQIPTEHGPAVPAAGLTGGDTGTDNR